MTARPREIPKADLTALAALARDYGLWVTLTTPTGLVVEVRPQQAEPADSENTCDAAFGRKRG